MVDKVRRRPGQGRCQDQDGSPPAPAVVLANMKGVMPLPALQDMWKEMEFEVKLDQSLLELLADEAGWIVDRGMVKAEKPTAAKSPGIHVRCPLKKASPARVKLPCKCARSW